MNNVYFFYFFQFKGVSIVATQPQGRRYTCNTLLLHWGHLLVSLSIPQDSRPHWKCSCTPKKLFTLVKFA